MVEKYIVVIDIGKTNKKVLLYNWSFSLVSSASKSFPEITHSGYNLHCEDPLVVPWLLEQLGSLVSTHGAESIMSIAVTTHGATFVGIDDNGNLAMPVLSYTQQMEEALEEEFYRLCGDPRELQRLTATPKFGSLINMAKGIFYAKKKSQVATTVTFFAASHVTLAGKVACDMTSIGCHTYLWDFQANSWSSVVDKLGIRHILPPVQNSVKVLGTISTITSQRTGLLPSTLVATGIHDSNASLVPYLAAMKGSDFAINSSGTWMVIMKPSKTAVFSESDLGKIILYNISVFGSPLRTVNFPGGMEFSEIVDIFAKKCANAVDLTSKFLSGNDASIYQDIITSKLLFIPGLLGPSSHFLHCNPGIVDASGNDHHFFSWQDIINDKKPLPAQIREYKAAMALLRLSLAVQTQQALLLAGASDGMPIFVEGGFKNDLIYCSLLAALFPQSRVAFSATVAATALGAAIIARAAADALSGPEPKVAEDLRSTDLDREMQFTLIPAAPLVGLPMYTEIFMDWAKNNHV